MKIDPVRAIELEYKLRKDKIASDFGKIFIISILLFILAIIVIVLNKLYCY